MFVNFSQVVRNTRRVNDARRVNDLQVVRSAGTAAERTPQERDASPCQGKGLVTKFWTNWGRKQEALPESRKDRARMYSRAKPSSVLSSDDPGPGKRE